MNKIIKIVPIILLLLFVGINSSTATKFFDTHIHGMKNVTVKQGESFNPHLQVFYQGLCREKEIDYERYHDTIHLYINDLNDKMITHYDIKLPALDGFHETVDTSNLEPGTYKMNASFKGRYTLCGLRYFHSSSASAYLTVLPENGILIVPTANNMSLVTTINKSFEGVFNVTDVNNGILNVIVVTAPTHGNITVNGTNFVYTPDPDYEGNDTFIYEVIEDSRLISNLATVNIQVLKGNTANNMSINTTINKLYKGIFNATNPYGRPLNALLVSAPSHGNVSIDGTNFVYTPDPDYEGDDNFSYKVNDSNGLVSDVARVDVQVVDNRLNVTAENLTRDLTKNMPLNIEILSNYNVVLVQLPLHGTATVENTRFNHPRIEYHPFKNYVGNDSFSYRLQSPDGKISNSAWINIIIRDWPV